MPKNTENTASNADHEVVITRVFNAPRELVFQAFSDVKALAQWWGPKGFTMNNCKLDFRPGGYFHYSMTPPVGQEMWGKFMYREIVAPEKIVFVNCFSDKDGNITQNPWLPTYPLEVLNVLTLTSQNDKTLVTLRGVPINATELQQKTFDDGRAGMQGGFAGTWAQLDEYLEKSKKGL